MFERKEDHQLFIEKVRHIADEEMSMPLFVLSSKSHRGLTRFDLRPKKIEWLEEGRQKVLNRMSIVMKKKNMSTINLSQGDSLEK